MSAIQYLKKQVILARARAGSDAFRKLCDASTIGGQRRIFHYHVRKTAGTSINQAFLSLGGEPGKTVYERMVHDRNYRTISGKYAYVGWSKPLIEQGLYHYAFSHAAAHELTMPPGTFTITCLREPLRRLTSHYQMLREFVDTNNPHPCMKTEGPWLGATFADFINTMPREHRCRQLYMFSREFNPQQAIERVRNCGFYFFTESFVDGMKQLGATLGEEIPVMHVRPTKVSYEIPEAEKQMARELLADEYVMIDALRDASAGE